MIIELNLSGTCNHCKKIKPYIPHNGKAKGLCKECYRKLIWEQKKKPCLRCNRVRALHAKKMCSGCYNSVFKINNVRKHNILKQFGIDMDLYNKLTKECLVCGFDKVIDLHYVDHNSKNNSPDNLVGLCPNHHKMIHHRNHQQEVFGHLQSLGYQTPKVHKPDSFYKNVII